MKPTNKGLLQLNFAVLLTGITTLFPKIILLPAVDIIFMRSLVSAVVLAVIILLTKKSIKLETSKEFYLLLIIGSIMAAHWVTFFQSIQVSSVAIAIIAFETCLCYHLCFFIAT